MDETDAVKLRKRLSDLIKSDELLIWLDVPNSAFGGLSPNQLIESGKISLLWDMVYRLESGDPST